MHKSCSIVQHILALRWNYQQANQQSIEKQNDSQQFFSILGIL